MVGSCWSRLLAILLLSVPFGLRGQDRVDPARDFALALPRPDSSPSILRDPVAFPPRLVPPGTIGLAQISRAAGIIFSGTVTGIERRAARGGNTVETVAIAFRVENAIRGATPGETLTISQWMGLWSSGQRYRVGERVLLFLYAPSKLGLTSCVSAPMGRFAIDPRGRVLLSAQHLSAFRADPVLGGKSRVRFSDFALAVRRASDEE
jgi:hypothetical protein